MSVQLFQLCLALCDPMNCNQPSFSAHGIIQAGILERVPIPSSRGSFDPKIEPAFPVSPALQANCIRASREAPSLWQGVPISSVHRFSSVQSLSCVWLFATLWTAARQASLSITNSGSLLKLMSIESVMLFHHLILCHPLLLLPSIFLSVRVFSNGSVLRIRWPRYWKDWCWSSGILLIWCEQTIHWKSPRCWERLSTEGEDGITGWDGWMESQMPWIWIWRNSGRWWGTRRPGVLQFTGSQRVGDGWVTEQQKQQHNSKSSKSKSKKQFPAWSQNWLPSSNNSHCQSPLHNLVERGGEDHLPSQMCLSWSVHHLCQCFKCWDLSSLFLSWKVCILYL